MLHRPTVAIIGRPNVGKSCIFNRILNKKVAVVDDRAGVTRDRNYAMTTWNDFHFYIVDTGGMMPNTQQSLMSSVNKQVQIAIEECDVIIFVVEALVGPTEEDSHIARHLRKQCAGKVLIAANKAESPTASFELSRHMQLGFGNPFPISALHGSGVADLLDAIVDKMKASTNHEHTINNEQSFDISLAIIGRPNSGKSSLVNRLLNDERMIVDHNPGTTRDAVDSVIHHSNAYIKLIDTAGLRKKHQVHDSVEYFANLRALRSIEHADVCILMIDTTQHLGEQDLKILSHVQKQKKGCIVCWNKWDLIEKDEKTFDSMLAEIRNHYPDLGHFHIMSISALTGLRVNKIIDYALTIKQKMQKWLSPAIVENNFFNWVKLHPHPFRVNKQVRFLGIKQQRTSYPLFTIFCTNPASVHSQYKRFLINKMYQTYDFLGCPLSLHFQSGRKILPNSETTSDEKE